MSRHVIKFHYVDVLPTLCRAFAFRRLRPIIVRARELPAHMALTVTGYLRPRPDPAVECALRTLFRDLDAELAGILGDRVPHRERDTETTKPSS